MRNTFIANRDEILAAVKREDRLRVLDTLDAETTNQLSKTFREQYPSIGLVK